MNESALWSRNIRRPFKLIYTLYLTIPFFLPIQVKLYGGYFQLLDFLEALENSDRFFVIRKLEIHSKDENLDCVLDMEIYAREA